MTYLNLTSELLVNANITWVSMLIIDAKKCQKIALEENNNLM